jgi:hypothetical protein
MWSIFKLLRNERKGLRSSLADCPVTHELNSLRAWEVRNHIADYWWRPNLHRMVYILTATATSPHCRLHHTSLPTSQLCRWHPLVVSIISRRLLHPCCLVCVWTLSYISFFLKYVNLSIWHFVGSGMLVLDSNTVMCAKISKVETRWTLYQTFLHVYNFSCEQSILTSIVF